MMVMVYVILGLLGLCLGSFVNALVWRLHEQESPSKKTNKKASKDLSIATGRSRCTDCGHNLGFWDLIPVLSWCALRGKCRYCKKPISWQYPLVELLTMGLFIASYVFWPVQLVDSMSSLLPFIVWLCVVVGLVAIMVYDIKWMIIPDRIVYPLIMLVIVSIGIQAIFLDGGPLRVRDAVLGLLVGSGFFYLVFVISKGKWIGGGDVKLGILLGLLLGARDAFIALYIASVVGAVFAITLIATKRAKRRSKVPFGPFLIAGTILAGLFGESIWNWYITRLG